MLITAAFFVGLFVPPPPPYDWYTHLERPLPDVVALQTRFPAPDGFERIQVPPDSYAAWLRKLPIRTDRTQVLAYDGRPLPRPSLAVVLLDVGTRDLQQCADSVLRLHAEYLWAQGRADEAAYHFTSGDRSAWRDWRAGERFKVKGSKVERVRRRASGRTREAFRAWLTHLFRYAGTRSLRHDSQPVGDAPLMPGDFFVQPGGPGHAVMILDVAESADGVRLGLVGQGFMPAEDFHVLDARGTRHRDDAWFVLPTKADPMLDTPSWRPFSRAQARRFKEKL